MNYVIIGNSCAAIGCIEGIRKIDKQNKITVISNEAYHTYGRPLISYWLGGKVSDEKIFYRPQDFYETNLCDLLLNETVNAIDAKAHIIHLASGKTIAFDKLLISTGSRAFVPPIEGLEQVKDCFNFMTYDDAKAINAALKPSSKVLIVGAGLIGLKAAEGIYETTKDITIIDLANHILPSILDEKGSSIVKDFLEDKGLKFYLNDSVAKFTSHTATLKSGEILDFDMVIVAVGVRPNVELAKEAGIEVNRGILINTASQTSIDDIFAAGDCTEGFDLSINQNSILALLPNAYMQGEAAGITMAGGEKVFDKAIPMNAIGFFGLHMITAGIYDGEAIVTETANSYKKLVLKDGYLKGFILIGDVLKRAGIYTSMIKEQISLSDVDIDLLLNHPQMMLFNKSRRIEKLGGIKPNMGGVQYGN